MRVEAAEEGALTRMGDKYAPRGGVPTKFIMMRKKLLILIFSFSLLLVLVIWNSSPLNRVSNDTPEEADLFRVASTLQHKVLIYPQSQHF